MFNFKKLVESLLCEAAGFTSTNAAFVQIMNELKTKFNEFNDGPEDSQFDAFKTIVQQRAFTRTAPGALSDPFMSPYLPLVDLLCLVNEKFKANTSSTHNMSFDSSFPESSNHILQAFNDVQQTFKNNLNAIPGNGLDPIAGYTKQSSGTIKGFYKQILSKYLSSGVIGKKALENFIAQNYTLIQAIMHIGNIRKDTRTIFSRTKVLPVIDNSLKDFFYHSEEYAPGAAGGPKQIPPSIKSLGAEECFILADLIKTYALSLAPAPAPSSSSSTAPDSSSVRKSEENTIDVVLNKKVSEIAQDNSTPEAAQIINLLTKYSDYEPGKKDYTGMVSGAQQLASAASGGVEFGR